MTDFNKLDPAGDSQDSDQVAVTRGDRTFRQSIGNLGAGRAEPGIAEITTDSSLSGDGTTEDPLSVANPYVLPATDSSLSGDGTTENPLSVANPYVLPAATEDAIGGVQNVSGTEAAVTNGVVFRAWSATMITKLIALWRTPVSEQEAASGTSDVNRWWSARRVRAAITAILPRVYQTGDTSLIPGAKLGTGLASDTRALFGSDTFSGTWREIVWTDLAGQIADSQVPSGITRDAALDPLVSGLSVSGSVLEGTRQSGTNPIEVALPVGQGLGFLGEWVPPGPISAAAAGKNIDTGIKLPTNPGDMDLYAVAAHVAGHSAVFRPISGRLIKSLPEEAVGDDNQNVELVSIEGAKFGMYGAKLPDGTLLVSHDEGSSGWLVGDYVALYRLADTAPSPGDVASSVVAAAKYPLEDVASGSLTSAYQENFFNIDKPKVEWNVGGIAINGDGRLVIPAAGLYHLETQVHFKPSSTDGRKTLYTRHRIQRGGSVITLSESLSTTYSRGTSTTPDIINEHADWHMLKAADVVIIDNKAEDSASTTAVAGATSHISAVGFAVGDEPSMQPSISSFIVRGDLAPAAGAINELYDYTFAVAQSAQLGAVRIVRLSGTDADPPSVTVLATIAEANWHGSSGQITVSGFSLAAGEIETVRLEVYTADQTPATDVPAGYQDVRITAHSPGAAFYHWGRIAVDSSDADAAATAARIVFADDDLVTGSSLASSYAATPPDTGTVLYQFYLAVRDGHPEPVGWNSGGLLADTAFQAPVTRMIGVVDYKFWVLRDLLARLSSDGSINYNPRLS